MSTGLVNKVQEHHTRGNLFNLFHKHLFTDEMKKERLSKLEGALWLWGEGKQQCVPDRTSGPKCSRNVVPQQVAQKMPKTKGQWNDEHFNDQGPHLSLCFCTLFMMCLCQTQEKEEEANFDLLSFYKIIKFLPSAKVQYRN